MILRRATLLAAGVIVCLLPAIATAAESLAQRIEHAWQFADQRTRANIAAIQADGTRWPVSTGTRSYPEYTENRTGQAVAQGDWYYSTTGGWGSGLWPGAMWKLHARSGDSYWANHATTWTLPVAGQATQTGDLTFRIFESFYPLYQHTTDPTQKAQYKNTILTAAASKMTVYSSTVKSFKTGGGSGSVTGSDFNFLLDHMMDQKILFWGAANHADAATRQDWQAKGVEHALTVANTMVRADGSSFQRGYWNSTTGQFLKGVTKQGYADDSTWTRGQAWGLYGFSETCSAIRDLASIDAGKKAAVLAAAMKMADYYVSHLPADSVPWWDFDPRAYDPAINPAGAKPYRDSSAGAIGASALLQLADLVTDPAARSRYISAAEGILYSLAGPGYLAEGTAHDGILARGSYYVANNAYEQSQIWGDFYFLEAMERLAAVPEPSATAPLAALAAALGRRRRSGCART